MSAVILMAISCSGPQISELTCEGLAEPLGIDSTSPHFSWKVSGAEKVSAWRIQAATSPSLLNGGKADLWDSGRTVSDCTVMVPYGGAALSSGEECFWRVKVWDENGRASGWSEVSRFSVAILEGLSGEYIGAFEGSDVAPLLSAAFNAEKGAECFVHVNSLGYHELYINGVKAGDAVLTPAVSQLDKRSLTVTYDVSSLLEGGENDIVIWAAKGNYRKTTYGATYDGPAVKAQVDVRKGYGKWETVLATGKGWKASRSGYVEPGNWRPYEFIGEEIDARETGADKYDVDIVRIEGMEETPMMCRSNVVKESFPAASVKAADKDGEPCWLVDMGREVLGQFEFHIPQMPEGSIVKAFYSDHLILTGFKEYDTMICSGREGGDVFLNRFSQHACRYVVITGLEKKPDVADIVAYRFSADLRETSSFECSDPDINAIHDMIKYTLQNLTYSGNQVDCPQIERLGYGGDGNSSTMTTQTMFDAAPLYLNWLTAWQDAQREDGGLPHTAPCPYPAGGGPYWCGFVIMASYRSLLNYGDIRMAERFYPVMKHWLDYVDTYTVEGLLKEWPETDYRGWYLGDWFPPAHEDATVQESIDIVSNCSLSQNYAALVKIAEALGQKDDAKDFEARRQALNARIFEEFYNPETRAMASGIQIDLAYPMLVGAVPEDKYDGVKEVLLSDRTNRYPRHLNTGLVGIPVLTEWTVANNAADFMYGMLKQPDFPGYLNMINNGATTTWEEWDDPRSYIHNCFNGIGTWFYQALGGIVPVEPGYRTFTLAPQIPEGMDWARVSKETPYGTIEVYWEKKNGEVSYDLTVPCGTTANFVDACGQQRVLKAGSYSF